MGRPPVLGIRTGGRGGPSWGGEGPSPNRTAQPGPNDAIGPKNLKKAAQRPLLLAPGRGGMMFPFSNGSRGGGAMRVSMTVNGSTSEHDVEPRLLLVYYLREVLGLTGTKVGCDTTSCGACTVLLNGESVKSCTMFAVQADGAEITTIEGLATNGDFHPMQQ